MDKIDGLQDLKKKEKVALNLLKSDLKRVYFVLMKFDDLVKSQKSRHSCESRSPDVVPRIKYGAGSAQAGNYTILLDSCFHRKPWIPAFAGMTKMGQKGLFTNPSNMEIL